MALDTANKRFSMMNLAMPFRAVLPLPDGALDQGDRQQFLYWYSGVLWGAAVVLDLFAIYTADWTERETYTATLEA